MCRLLPGNCAVLDIGKLRDRKILLIFLALHLLRVLLLMDFPKKILNSRQLAVFQWHLLGWRFLVLLLLIRSLMPDKLSAVSLLVWLWVCCSIFSKMVYKLCRVALYRCEVHRGRAGVDPRNFGLEFLLVGGRLIRTDRAFLRQKTAYDIGLGIPAEPLFR